MMAGCESRTTVTDKDYVTVFLSFKYAPLPSHAGKSSLAALSGQSLPGLGSPRQTSLQTAATKPNLHLAPRQFATGQTVRRAVL